MGNFCSIQVSCDAIFTRCLDCTVKRAKYIRDLEENLDLLQKELQKLIEAKNDVMRRVNIAERRQKKRTDQVQGWFSRVEAVEAEVSELLKSKSQECEKSCLGGYCSKNCTSRYKFGRKVTKNLKVVANLKNEGDFEVVAVRFLNDLVDEIPVEPTIVGLQSTFDEVRRFLREEEVGIIGLYGTGGVGKTTLLKQIFNSFCNESHHFDLVLWVVVSKEPNFEKIQEDIGEKIGLLDDKSWKDKSLQKKAHDIFNVLKKKKFVLLLDDIWKRIDLTEVGVPLPSPKIESKIVFTTRFLEVCGQMNAHECLRLQCLASPEAWKLFEQNLQRDVLGSHPDIPEQAKIVAKECGGLPLALVTISRAMSCKKTPEEWRYAVHALRSSASTFAGMGTDVYPLLKFSYDSLPDNLVRSCFLYCSLFPEDYRIPVATLISYWIGEGYFDGYDESEVHSRGSYIIGVLVDACLLEKGEGREEYFLKMHDVIRDMALWIACEIEKEKENFLVQAGMGLMEAPEIGKWEGVKRVSLMENRIENLLQTPRCYNLRTLFLGGNPLKMIITSDFFQFMPSLKVLNLSNNRSLIELPSGISNLVSLQHLNLSWTSIKELPVELKALENLKCLDLGFTFDLRTIPHQLISSFSKLIALEMFWCGYSHFGQAAEDSVLFGGGESLVEELIGLRNLNVLAITLRSSCALQKFLSSVKLRNSTQSLSLQCFEHSKSLNILSLSELNHLDKLHITDCRYLEELKIEYVRGTQQSYGFQCLHTVLILSCSNLRNLTWLVFVPNLKFLDIFHCNEMREIISAENLHEVTNMMPNLIPFEKLQSLELHNLYNLKSIYWEALPFPHLKEIKVIGCPKLKKLPLDSNSAKERKIAITGEEVWWNKLQWKNEATQNAFLHSFISF